MPSLNRRETGSNFCLTMNRVASRRYVTNPLWYEVPSEIPKKLQERLDRKDILIDYLLFLQSVKWLKKRSRLDLSGEPTIMHSSYLTDSGRIIYSNPFSFPEEIRLCSLEVKAYNIGLVFKLTDELGLPRK